MFLRSICPLRNFYPRPPRGGRLGLSVYFHSGQVFLSTPSARRATLLWLHCTTTPGISIHALREEGDVAVLYGQLFRVISIHALREEGDSCRPAR